MKKTINKIIGLFSLGLLLFAATDSYAQSAEKKLFQDAWTFMSEHTKDGGAAFRSKYGNEEGSHLNIVDCGPRKCNLNFRKCMSRKDGKTKVDYRCAKEDEVAKLKQRGFVESSGGKNPGQKTKKAKKEKDCYEAKIANTNQEAKIYCTKVIGERVEVMSAVSENKGRCEVVEVAWYNSRNCLFCPLIGVLYAVADKITVTAYKAFARSFAIVIAVGLAVWIAFKTLAFVSSLTKQDIAKYLTEMLIQSFKFLIAFFALLYYEEIFSMIIRPLIRAGMAFGTTFVLVDDLYSRFGEEVFKALVTAGTTGDGTALSALGSKVPSDYSRNANNMFYDVYTYATMENLAHNVNLQYSLLQTIGGSLTCIGFKLLMFRIPAESIGEGFALGFASIIYGICFGIFGFLLSIAFVVYLLDVVVQLGIVGGMLPFLVASWPFKLTSGYTKKGFEMILNSIFTFMMMGVVVNLSIELIKAAVEFNSDSGAVGETENGLSAMIKALTEIDVKKLSTMVNVISIGFLLFMMSNIMAMMLLGKVTEFANQFASGAMPAISSEFATRAASTVKGIAKKAASPLVEGFKEEISEVTKPVRDDLKEKIHTGVKNVATNVRHNVGQGIKTAANATLGQTKAGRKVIAAAGTVAGAVENVQQKLYEAKQERLAKNEADKQEKQHQNSESINDILS